MGFSVTLPFHFLKPNWKKTKLYIFKAQLD